MDIDLKKKQTKWWEFPSARLPGYTETEGNFLRNVCPGASSHRRDGETVNDRDDNDLPNRLEFVLFCERTAINKRETLYSFVSLFIYTSTEPINKWRKISSRDLKNCVAWRSVIYVTSNDILTNEPIDHVLLVGSVSCCFLFQEIVGKKERSTKQNVFAYRKTLNYIILNVRSWTHLTLLQLCGIIFFRL